MENRSILSEKLINDSSYLAAKHIMEMLKEENIVSPTHISDLAPIDLDIFRKIAQPSAINANYLAPGLTACIASTYLKAGLCLELSQRFIAEYVLHYKKQDIALICLSTPEGHKSEDHMFVVIGEVFTPEQLNFGEKPTRIDNKRNQLISEFFEINKNCIFADPLLKCFGDIKSDMNPLLEYCKKYAITHVISIRSFHKTPGMIENMPRIHQNARALAENLRGIVTIKTSDLPSTQVNEDTIEQKDVKLSDLTQKYFEKKLSWGKYPDDKLAGKYIGHQVRFFTINITKQEAGDFVSHLKKDGFEAELKSANNKPSIVVDLTLSTLKK